MQSTTGAKGLQLPTTHIRNLSLRSNKCFLFSLTVTQAKLKDQQSISPLAPKRENKEACKCFLILYVVQHMNAYYILSSGNF